MADDAPALICKTSQKLAQRLKGGRVVVPMRRIFELANRQVAPALKLQRESRISEAGQEKQGLQNGRLADVVGAKQDVEPAQPVEIECRQATEPADLNPIKGLVSRHACSTLAAESDEPTEVAWAG